MGFAQQERDALCDALDAVGPQAPTLCEGWDAHDLAAHLWLRENDPAAATGILIPALAEVTRTRTEQLMRRWHYAELVQRIRKGPGPVSVFSLPGVDDLANTGEFFVHCEDVRRANGEGPRATTREFEDEIAKGLARTAKALFRDAPAGIVLERTDVPQRMRARKGGRTITLAGTPSELLLFAFGRMSVARVDVIGEDADVEDLLADHRGF
ncbi:TIGR03085 family protein [Propioniciclava coleopterorum]|uniref:TIGR03085 family protein n=1 Tax=Propioniciclava coleopterorum TaxID=2714937 RepID=A0A6G7YAD8_9ACTN|nr:TIGR03085 family metal-binding protein [Propioniciclava coleopterorum]QIK73611.1 TIGR03085 family protein [Propioniciclava coleopterorum]